MPKLFRSKRLRQAINHNLKLTHSESLHFFNLMPEINLTIIAHLSPKDLISLASTSRFFHCLINAEYFIPRIATYHLHQHLELQIYKRSEYQKPIIPTKALLTWSNKKINLNILLNLEAYSLLLTIAFLAYLNSISSSATLVNTFSLLLRALKFMLIPHVFLKIYEKSMLNKYESKLLAVNTSLNVTIIKIENINRQHHVPLITENELKTTIQPLHTLHFRK